ncbi:MAG: hypothetical protein WDN45_01575 [Caulobacteraceae bacterium]
MNAKLLGRSRGTVFAQVFALVLFAVTGAEGDQPVDRLHLPPPAPTFYTEADVMRAMRGQAPVSRPDKNAPPLVIRKEPQAPADRIRGRASDSSVSAG